MTQNNDKQIGLAEYCSLYTTTRAAVKTARNLARDGQKAQALAWHRFILNAGLITILKSADFDLLKTSKPDVANLEWELGQLYNDCHPCAKPEIGGNLNEIVDKLDHIAAGVSMQINLLQALATKGGGK